MIRRLDIRWGRIQDMLTERKGFNVYRERGFFVLHHVPSNRKRFYARPSDILNLLQKPLSEEAVP